MSRCQKRTRFTRSMVRPGTWDKVDVPEALAGYDISGSETFRGGQGAAARVESPMVAP